MVSVPNHELSLLILLRAQDERKLSNTCELLGRIETLVYFAFQSAFCIPQSAIVEC
jgi:hypothetical protein